MVIAGQTGGSRGACARSVASHFHCCALIDPPSLRAECRCLFCWRSAGKRDEAADDEEDADGDSEMKQAGAAEEKKEAPKAGQTCSMLSFAEWFDFDLLCSDLLVFATAAGKGRKRSRSPAVGVGAGSGSGDSEGSILFSAYCLICCLIRSHVAAVSMLNCRAGCEARSRREQGRVSPFHSRTTFWDNGSE